MINYQMNSSEIPALCLHKRMTERVQQSTVIMRVRVRCKQTLAL